MMRSLSDLSFSIDFSLMSLMISSNFNFSVASSFFKANSSSFSLIIASSKLFFSALYFLRSIVTSFSASRLAKFSVKSKNSLFFFVISSSNFRFSSFNFSSFEESSASLEVILVNSFSNVSTSAFTFL